MTLREEIEKRIDLIVKEKPHAGFNFNRHADDLETLVNNQITSFAERVKDVGTEKSITFQETVDYAVNEALRGDSSEN